MDGLARQAAQQMMHGKVPNRDIGVQTDPYTPLGPLAFSGHAKVLKNNNSGKQPSTHLAHLIFVSHPHNDAAHDVLNPPTEGTAAGQWWAEPEP